MNPTQPRRFTSFTRPNLHITSPYGWLNGPCAPAYDSNTGLYHLFYQCNPDGVQWGDCSWGHATSQDLLRWVFASSHAPIRPDKNYDKDGVFTGCMGPKVEADKLEAFYSSVKHLPFHWTDPAPRGSVGLAMAISTDGGKTWRKSEQNPIVTQEPLHLDVTGFRDPYLASWPALDKLRGKKSLYGLISGGIQGVGPTSFLYEVDPSDRSIWKHLGPLVDLPERHQPSLKWECNYGVNWECVNFLTLTLPNSNVTRDFLILGSEGDVDRDHIGAYNLPPLLPPRTTRHQQWMCGDLAKQKSGDIRIQHRCGGILDHGCYYAANSFEDPKTGRRIVYGWIPEEDSSLEHCEQKGWNGALALPREVFLQSIQGITGTIRSPLESVACIEIENQDGNTNIIYTLGVRPLAELETLRANALAKHHLPQFSLSSKSVSSPSPCRTATRHLTNTATPTWELLSTILIKSTTHKVGFHIRHSSDAQIRTTITFCVPDETITVDRSRSLPLTATAEYKPAATIDDTTDIKDHDTAVNITTPTATAKSTTLPFNLCPELGPFTLFTTSLKTDPNANTNTSSSRSPPRAPIIETEIEKLTLRIISDGDTLEIFANDRFALATMIYTGIYDSSCGGITAFVESDSEDDAFSAAGKKRKREKFTSGEGIAEQQEGKDDGDEAVIFEETMIWDGLNGGQSLIGEAADWAPRPKKVEKINRKEEDGTEDAGTASDSSKAKI